MKQTARVIDQPAKAPTEADVMKAVKKHLKTHGWYCYRNQQNIGSHPGISDLTAIRAGEVLWIECKSPKWKEKREEVRSKTERAQYEFERRIIEAGGIYLRVQSIYGLDSVIGG